MSTCKKGYTVFDYFAYVRIDMIRRRIVPVKIMKRKGKIEDETRLAELS